MKIENPSLVTPLMETRSVGRGCEVTLPIAGGGSFSVRRVYCIGANYSAHAEEMEINVDPALPFFFMKPTDAVVPNGSKIPYPPMTNDYQHEVELVIAIGAAGCNIAVSEARQHIFGYAVGLDMTRRDVQFAAKDRGLPWDMAKGSDYSAPCGEITPAKSCDDLTEAEIRLDVNGRNRQLSSLGNVTWTAEEVIHWLSQYVAIKPGDLIYTGSPEGVAPVNRGDVISASIAGLSPLTVFIT